METLPNTLKPLTIWRSSLPDLIPLNRVTSLLQLQRGFIIALLREGKFPLPTKGWDNRIMWHKSEVLSWKP